MNERISASLAERRTTMLLLMLFAGAALILAAVGIYGVLAFGVAQRSGEIGVRMSLGASSRDIVHMVLLDGGRLTGLGLALGSMIALALAYLMRTQLFDIDVIDPMTLGVVTTVIAATALLACWLPARHAAAVDPLVALRHE